MSLQALIMSLICQIDCVAVYVSLPHVWKRAPFYYMLQKVINIITYAFCRTSTAPTDSGEFERPKLIRRVGFVRRDKYASGVATIFCCTVDLLLWFSRPERCAIMHFLQIHLFCSCQDHIEIITFDNLIDKFLKFFFLFSSIWRHVFSYVAGTADRSPLM